MSTYFKQSKDEYIEKLHGQKNNLLVCVRDLLELVPHFPEGSKSAKTVDAVISIVARIEGEKP